MKDIDNIRNQGGGGHVIENASGTSMTQRENLQFVGVYTEDDAANDSTKVNIVREMTSTQMQSLTTAQKKGFIRTTDEPNNPSTDIDKKTAQFTLGNENIALSGSGSEQITNGSWSIQDTDSYSVSGASLVIKQAGTYLITNETHGVVNINSTVIVYVGVSTVGGGFAHVTDHTTDLPYQFKNSGSAIVTVPANTILSWWVASSDSNNVLFGRSMSLDNRLTVCKLG